MKHIILSALVSCASLLSAQNTLHVYSMDIPWSDTAPTQESGKIYQITEAIAIANAGDSIIIHEGVYREEIKVNKNNLKFANYQDDYVLVSGTELVTGWSQASDMEAGVMQANISSLNIEPSFSQLFYDGAIQQMARFPNNTTGKMMEPMDPNSGYGLLDKVWKDQGEEANCYATFKDITFPTVDLTGGIFRALTGKNREYIVGDITAKSRSAITFKASNNGPWTAEDAIANTYHKFGYGYIFHKNLIDVPGEWYVDGNIVYYMPHSDNIDNERIELQVREYVLSIDNVDGTSISGLNFSAGLARIEDADNNTVEACSFRYLSPFFRPNGYGMNESGAKGFYIENCDNNTLKDNYIAHNWGSMLTLKECNNSTVENCVIKDFGWIAIFTAAVYLRESDETTLSQCTFAEGARFHLRIDGQGGKLTMTDCDLYDAMKMGEDAGPVEVTSTGRIGALNLKGSEIAYNKVRDCYGLPVSSGGYLRQKITAFYMEDTENYTAHHNLIYNFLADNYTGEYEDELEKHGEFLYLGPRYNPMYHPVNYYNNTVWDVNQIMGVWNIEIDNWKALGLEAPDTTGFMRDGHFANNIIIDGPEYKMSYVRQVLSATGGNLGYVTLSPSPSYYSSNFETYAAKAKALGYEFNPENNVFFSSTVGNRYFVDAKNGDFRLQTSATPAIGAGIPIAGITSSDTPDCGALEGSDRVLHAGAQLSTPDFKEDVNYTSTAIRTVETVEFNVYPNPASQQLTVALDENRPALVSLFDLSGRRVLSQNILKQNTIDISSLSAGMYLVKVKTEHSEALKPILIK